MSSVGITLKLAMSISIPSKKLAFGGMYTCRRGITTIICRQFTSPQRRFIAPESNVFNAKLPITAALEAPEAPAAPDVRVSAAPPSYI